MTHAPALKLREFTTDQLIEELARRRNERSSAKPREWCDDCAHFIPWVDAADTPEASMPNGYNPCEMGHSMRFQMPEEIDDDYGHYRTVCPDRQPAKDFSHA